MRRMPTQFDWIYQLYVEQHSKKEPIDQRTKLQGDDFYYVDGIMVMTETYHIKRGSCCGNGCRHCPYTPKHQKGNNKLNESYESKD